MNNNRKKNLIGCITLSLFAGTLTAYNINQYGAKLKEKKHVFVMQRTMANLLHLRIFTNILKEEKFSSCSMKEPLIRELLMQLQQNKAIQQHARLFEDCLAGNSDHCKKIFTFIPQANEWKDIKTKADRLLPDLFEDKAKDLFLSKIKIDSSLEEKLKLAQHINKLCSFLIEKCDQGMLVSDVEIFKEENKWETRFQAFVSLAQEPEPIQLWMRPLPESSI